MKKTINISIIVLILSFVISTGLTNAQITNTSTTSNRTNRIENRIERKDVRNEKIEDMKEKIAEKKEQIKENRASTTAMFKNIKNEKREVLKKMKIREFEIRKNALLKELNIAIRNLNSLNTKINERITNLDNQGKNTSEIKISLSIAKEKFEIAKTAVATLSSYSYASSTNASSTDIDLERPRKIGDEAIKAIKTARDEFKKVIVLIAKLQGNNATSTLPVKND